MRRFHLHQVDVFTTTPLAGNPAAVFPDAGDLTPAEMQAIAREMNLSETTFVLPPTVPGADYRLRIFTPRRELPFAGHPTIGTVAVLIDAGRLPAPATRSIVRQECGAGLIEVTVEARPAGLAYLIAMPPASWTAAAVSRDECAAMLACAPSDLADGPPAVVSPGVPWLIVQLCSWQAVRALHPDQGRMATVAARAGTTGVTVFALGAEDPRCGARVRSFAPGEGIVEDPVCGSGNGAVGAYIAHQELLGATDFAYVAEQGAEVARPGRVMVEGRRDAGGAWRLSVGGHAVVIMDAELRLS